MSILDELNKAVSVAYSPKEKLENRKAAIRDVNRIEAESAQKGINFERVKNGSGPEQYRIVNSAPTSELQREYCRKFDHKDKVGPEGETYREMAAKRCGIPCPA